MVSERIKVTLNLDAEVVRAYRVLAARKGKHDNAVVEEALRKHLGVGLLEALPSLTTARALGDEEADQIAVTAVREMRRERKNAE